MSPVVDFTGKTLDARNAAGEANIVACIEDALVLANQGKLHAIAIAMVVDDGSTVETWAAPWCNHRLMSAIAYLQHRYAAHEIENVRGSDG